MAERKVLLDVDKHIDWRRVRTVESRFAGGANRRQRPRAARQAGVGRYVKLDLLHRLSIGAESEETSDSGTMQWANQAF